MHSTLPTKAPIAKNSNAAWLFALMMLGVVTGCASPTPEVSTSEDISRIERILERSAESRSYSITRQHAQELVNTSLNFTGRVVNVEGKGIADAQIGLSVFDRVLAPFHFPYFGYSKLHAIHSDADGYFHMRAHRGVGFHIDVTKTGYTPVGLTHRTYQIEHVLLAGGHHEMPPDGEAALFVLRPTTARDTLHTIVTGAVMFDKDGTPVDVSLDNINPHGEAAGEGDISIGCAVEDLSEEPYDWFCRVAVREGGVQLQDRLDFIDAPEDGYMPAIVIGFEAESHEWSDRIDEGLFLRLASGHYAYVTLRVRTRGDQYFALQGRLNPHGSPRLE